MGVTKQQANDYAVAVDLNDKTLKILLIATILNRDNPNTKFKPILGKTSRNISTIISSAGFTPVLRDLFFPTVSNDEIVFRPWVSREEADRENIDTEVLDNQLRDLGAYTRLIREPK